MAGGIGLGEQIFISSAAGSGLGWPNSHATILSPLGGGLDDTPQIRTAINNAVANAQSRGDGYAEVIFSPGVYQIKSPLVQGAPTYGNSQIPLPIVSTTAQKVQLVLHCPGADGSTLPLWSQTVGQKAGAVLYTSGVTGTADPTYDNASVLGGPTPLQGYGNSSGTVNGFAAYTYNNMNIVIDGISVVSAIVNPTLCAMDFRGMAQMNMGRCGAFCDAGTSTVSTTAPTNNWAYGLRGPWQGNNDLCNVESWSAEGYYNGFEVSEHIVAKRVCVVYCINGIVVYSQTYAHGNIITYASVESCVYGVTWNTYTHCIIETLDVEHNPAAPFTPVYDIADPGGGNARGYIGFQISGAGSGEGTEPLVQFSPNVKIVNVGRKSATANTADGFPAVPASATPLQNPLWRDAFVSIAGGTVTLIELNVGNVGYRTIASGTSLSPMTVPLPTNGYIRLTYSVAPTWTWTLI